MDSPSTKDTPAKNDAHLGISFGDVHTDEPHEEVTAQQARAPQKGSTPTSHLASSGGLFNVSKAFENEHIETGTIVSDRRRVRPSLGSSLIAAYTEWLGNAKKTFTHVLEKIPTDIEVEKEPVIEKVENRSAVVKEAATNVVLAPKDDHKVVVEKIRTFKLDAAKIAGTPITLKEPQKQEQKWTHTFERAPVSSDVAKRPEKKIETPDLRKTMIAPVIEKKIQKEVPVTVPQAPVPPPHSVPVPPLVQRQIPTPKPIASRTPTIDTKSLVAPIVALPTKKDAARTIASNISESTVAPVIEKKIQKEVPVTVPQAPVPPPVSHEVKPHELHIPSLTEREPVKPAPAMDFVAIPPAPRVPVREEVLPVREEFHSTDTSFVAKQPMVHSDVEPQKPIEAAQPNVSTSASVVHHSSYTSLLRTLLKGSLVLGTVALCVVLIFVVRESFTNRETSVEIVPTPDVADTPAEPHAALTLATSREEFLSALQMLVVNAPAGISQFSPTTSSLPGSPLATSDEIFTLLETHLNDRTQRSLNDTVIFGSVTTEKNEPFIILESSNFDVLFSGLLTWETYIYEDFYPFFGDAFLNDVRPFKDAVRGNASTRILYDDAGNELLLYSFIDTSRVVITTSSEALSKIITAF